MLLLKSFYFLTVDGRLCPFIICQDVGCKTGLIRVDFEKPMYKNKPNSNLLELIKLGSDKSLSKYSKRQV